MSMSAMLVPPPLGVSEEEAQQRFEALQAKLEDQWRLIDGFSVEEQTMVVVPSVSCWERMTANEKDLKSGRLWDSCWEKRMANEKDWPLGCLWAACLEHRMVNETDWLLGFWLASYSVRMMVN